MKQTVAEAIVKIMVKEGVKTAFGIPGAAINPVYKHLEPAPIEHFTMRHEEACLHAADGYFSLEIAPEPEEDPFAAERLRTVMETVTAGFQAIEEGYPEYLRCEG